MHSSSMALEEQVVDGRGCYTDRTVQSASRSGATLPKSELRERLTYIPVVTDDLLDGKPHVKGIAPMPTGAGPDLAIASEVGSTSSTFFRW